MYFIGDPVVKEIEYTVDRNTEWNGDPFSFDHFTCIVLNNGQEQLRYENPFVDTQPGDVFTYSFTIRLRNGSKFTAGKENFTLDVAGPRNIKDKFIRLKIANSTSLTMQPYQNSLYEELAISKYNLRI